MNIRQIEQMKKIWYQLTDRSKKPRRIWLVVFLLAFGGTLMILPFSVSLLYTILAFIMIAVIAGVVIRFVGEARYVQLVHRLKSDQKDEVTYVSDSSSSTDR